MCRFYNHSKVKHIRIVRNPFLMCRWLWKGAAYFFEENDLIIKNPHRHIQLDSFESTLNSPVSIQLYTLYPKLNIGSEVYNWWLYVDIIRHIFWTKIFNLSTIFIWLNATYIITIFVTPNYNETVPLVQHCVIKNGTVYGVSYFFAVCSVSITLSPTLYSWSTLCLSLLMLLLLISIWFRWRIHSQSTLCFIDRIISQPNTNWGGL